MELTSIFYSQINMHRDIFEITKKGLRFEPNSTSFSESVIYNT